MEKSDLDNSVAVGADTAAGAGTGRRRKRDSLAFKVLAGLVVGIGLGVLAQWVGSHAVPLWNYSGRVVTTADALQWFSRNVAFPVGAIFLNLMFMVVVPLVFSSLALGVAGLGDLRTVGRLGVRILLGTLFLSVAGVVIGITMVNVIRPGTGLDPNAQARLKQETQTTEVKTRLAQSKAAAGFGEIVAGAVSTNPLEDAVNLFTPNPNYRGGGILAFLIAAAIAGAAITSIPPERAAPTVRLLESVQDLSMAVVGFAMRLAPYGVAALVFQTTAKVGWPFFALLGKYVGTVLGGLALQMLVVYPIALRFGAGMGARRFFGVVEEVIVTAFSTSSSNATLPTSLRVAQTRLRLPKAISSFVLTVGATANQNGTALFEGITVLFLAQFYGVHLELSQQLLVVLMSVVAGVGTAGVPGGSLPLIALLLTQIGIPAEGIGVVMGVDRFLDMCRTVVNVVGDIVLATVVSGKRAIEAAAGAEAGVSASERDTELLPGDII